MRHFLLMLGVVGLLVLSWKLGSEVDALLALVRRQGIIGPVILACMHFCAVVCCFPGAVLFELGSGLIFRFPLGFLTIMTSKTVAAGFTFWLGRLFLQNWVKEKIRTYPKVRKLYQHASTEGWKLVVLMRLSPFPSYLSNYGFALTDLPFWEYFCVSSIVMLPMIAQNVYVGSMLVNVNDVLRGRSQGSSLLRSIPVLAVVGIGIYITKWLYGIMNQQQYKRYPKHIL